MRISVAAPGGIKSAAPAAEQEAAITYVVTNQDAIRDAILSKLLRIYRRARKERIEDGDDDDVELDLSDEAFDRWWAGEEEEEDAPRRSTALPDVTRASDLRGVMGLGVLHVLAVAKAGRAFVGFEFGCDWDQEHGAGAMVHGRRVIDVGGADVAFLEWKATRAGGKVLAPEGGQGPRKHSRARDAKARRSAKARRAR